MHQIARSNTNLELAVQVGIIIDADLGGLSAWMFMTSQGVSDSIILRVLLNAEQRREADQSLLNAAQKLKEMRGVAITDRNFSRISESRIRA